jgi:MAPEG family
MIKNTNIQLPATNPAMTGTQSQPPSTSLDPAPSPVMILISYIILGSLISFLTGREPGTLPEDVIREVAPALIVVCGFLTSYSLWDVLAVGTAKGEAKYLDKKYKDLHSQMPEEVHLALRVQTNQVEQMPLFIVGSLSCAIVVNGTVAAVLALVWAILRRCYASAYRNGVGKTMAEIGLGKYTIPAYFASHAMLMATIVHAVRCILSG